MSKLRFKVIPSVYLFMRKGNKILLLQRANTGYQDGNYAVPAGHMDGGELPTQAMIREALEETGVKIDPKDLRFVHVSHRLNGGPSDERVDYFFETIKWQGQVINQEPEKCTDLSWFEIDQLPNNMAPFVEEVIGFYLRGVTYSEYEFEPIKIDQ